MLQSYVALLGAIKSMPVGFSPPLHVASQQQKLDGYSGALGVIMSVVVLPFAAHRTSAEWALALVSGWAFAAWLLPVLSYSRWRTVLVVLVRAVIFRLPHFRDPKFVPPRLLYAPADGPFGFAIDAFRVLMGTRTFFLVFGSMLLPLPLTLHVLLAPLSIPWRRESLTGMCSSKSSRRPLLSAYCNNGGGLCGALVDLAQSLFDVKGTLLITSSLAPLPVEHN